MHSIHWYSQKRKKNVFQIASELYIFNKVWLMNQNALRLKGHKENEQRREKERIFLYPVHSPWLWFGYITDIKYADKEMPNLLWDMPEN